MLETLALGIVVVAGLYLCALAAVSIFAPSRARSFLLGFATSQRLHFIELLVRIIVGGAFVIYAPSMFLPSVFGFFGWLLVGTTAGLILLPWQWHQRFAQYAVPRAIRFLPLIGLCSLALGLFILAAATNGNAA